MKNLIKYFKNHEKAFLLLLVFLGIILRSIYTYYIYSSEGTSNWTDDWEYLSMGKQIAAGNWDPKENNAEYMVVAPSIPIIVALFVLLFNNPIIPFFIYNIIITSLMIPVLYYLGKELFSKKVGWFLAIWGVFFVEAYKYSPHILKEPTLFFLVSLTLLFIIRSIKRKEQSVKNLIFAALSFTWLIHADERYFIYLPIFVLFFLLIQPFKLSAIIKNAFVWVVFVFLLMLPWGVRNYVVFDQFVILSPRTTSITSKIWGTNLAASASHFSDEGSKQMLIERRYDKAIQFGNQYGINPREYGKQEAIDRAFINFWQPTYFNPTFIQYGYRPMKWSFRHNASSILFYGIFIPFYIIGFFVLIKRRHYLALAVGTIPFIHSLLHAYMVWPLERYRSPITFIVVLIGIWAATEIINQIARRRTI